jgi:glycosyltransferase involved in cell wall biosynthesis
MQKKIQFRCFYTAKQHILLSLVGFLRRFEHPGGDPLELHKTTRAEIEHTPVSLLAVIVLYKSTPKSSSSFRTLQDAMKQMPQGKLRLRILLYDNTPQGKAPDALPEAVDYEASPSNRGLPDAYNRGLEIAEKEGFHWLLTLDQDTALPIDFLANLCEVILSVEASSEIAAVVPQLLEKGRILSPEHFLLNAFPRFLPRGFVGISRHPTFAFNSGSTLRVSALHEIGGYSPLFWLDYCDAYIYSRLNRKGKKIFVAGNIQVEHEFSMLDANQRVTLERYRNIVQAGCAFWDMEMGTLAGFRHTTSLIYRLCKHSRRGDDPAVRRVTREMLVKRIFQSKEHRIGQWKTEMERRFASNLSEVTAQGSAVMRPRVSVCMATYNGARFMKQQLDSILVQLGTGDELIVVDDASTDSTWRILCDIRDRRVRLFRNEQNKGVVLTFERAVSNAKGDYVFLSDQDDIWRQGKVKQVLAVFEKEPSVSLVVTNGVKIDENNCSLEVTMFSRENPAKLGLLQTLKRNLYQGSLMAFKRGILQAALPFPEGIPMHDSWIGLVNCIVGKTYYLDEELLYYRRHDANVTRDERAPVWKMITDRWRLLICFAGRYSQLLSIRQRSSCSTESNN